jgi:hypothetical protein
LSQIVTGLREDSTLRKTDISHVVVTITNLCVDNGGAHTKDSTYKEQYSHPDVHHHLA